MSIAGNIAKILNFKAQYSAVTRLQECRYHRWVSPTLRTLRFRAKKAPPKVYPRNTYLEWNQEAEMFAFGKRLKEEFDPIKLQEAFTHRSYIVQEEIRQKALGIEDPDLKLRDNRELAAEGESFMSDYIRIYLESNLPKFPEAGILAIRDYLMQQKILANISSHIGTKDLIQCSSYPPTEEDFANTFKAIVAALVHSANTEQAAHFVRDFVLTQLNRMDVNELWQIDDPMAMLKELLSKQGKAEPEPRLIGEAGRNTVLACFRVGLYIDKQLFAAGFGESVDIAKEMAAREGLKILFGTEDNMAPINFKLKGVPEQKSQRMKSLASS